MAAVQPVRHPEDRRQLGDGQIGSMVHARRQPHIFIIGERLMVVADHVGDDLPFSVGKTDDLRGHDDLIGAFSQIHHADIFSAVVKESRDAKKQPFPLPQPVQLPAAVKDRHADMLQGLAAPFASQETFADVSCAGDDVLIKIVLRHQDPVFLRIFVGDAVAEGHAGRPDQLRVHQLQNPADQSGGGAHQPEILL